MSDINKMQICTVRAFFEDALQQGFSENVVREAQRNSVALANCVKSWLE